MIGTLRSWFGGGQKAPRGTLDNPASVSRAVQVVSPSDPIADPALTLGNPLSDLDPARVAALFEGALRGEYLDIQWLLEWVCRTDPYVLALVSRRESALARLDWQVKQQEGDRVDALLAAEQQAALEAWYYSRAELTDVVKHLANATFAGYAHVYRRSDGGLTPMAPWWFLRDGMFGAWYYNPDARQTTAAAMTEQDKLAAGRWITWERPRSLLFPSILCYLRSMWSNRWWDKFCEATSKLGIVIVGPEGMNTSQVEDFKSDAGRIALGGSGVLPNGSSVVGTNTVRGNPPYGARLEDLRTALVVAATGGMLTTLAAPTGLGSGVAEAQDAVFDELVTADAMQISGLLQRTLDTSIIKARFPGRPVLAYFELAKPDADTKPADLADLNAKLAAGGYRIRLEALAEATGLDLEPVPAPAAMGAGAAVPTPATVPPAGAATDVAEASVSSALSLNGAQVQAAQEIVAAVAAGTLPRQSGVAMLQTFFALSEAAADGIMADIGRGFTPAAPPAAPAPVASSATTQPDPPGVVANAEPLAAAVAAAAAAEPAKTSPPAPSRPAQRRVPPAPPPAAIPPAWSAPIAESVQDIADLVQAGGSAEDVRDHIGDLTRLMGKLDHDALAGVLEQGMRAAVAAGLAAELESPAVAAPFVAARATAGQSKAGAVAHAKPAKGKRGADAMGPIKAAVEELAGKKLAPSAMRSDEWQAMPQEIRDAAFFSARVESAALLQQMKDRLQKTLELQTQEDGAFIDRSAFIREMRRVQEEAGFELNEGGEGAITDLTGAGRLGLIYDMQTSMAQEHARHAMHLDPDVLAAFPARELVRLEPRNQPRDWETRWKEKGGTLSRGGRMVAAVGDPIWTAISAFGHPYPPFDWGSGMGVVDLDAAEAARLGVKGGKPGDQPGLTDGLEASVTDLDRDTLLALREALGGGDVDGGKIRPPKRQAGGRR